MASYPNSGGIAKVLVVGNVATGKTSVIKRYVRNSFTADYQTTIGVDFAFKRVTTDGVDINVQLWDIAGQERFAGLSRIFYTHAVAAVIVYDIMDRDSYESAVKWKQDIDAKVFLPSGAKIPVLLLANKSDLISEGSTAAVSDGEMDNLCKEHQFFAAYKCSAKTGENIKEACSALVTQIVKNNKKELEKAEQEKESRRSESVSDRPAIKLEGSDSNTPAAAPTGCCS